MQMDVDFEAEWPCNEDAMQCHRYMLQNKRAFDVWFAVGPPENIRRIGAHKYMLSARSHTFYLMFNGPNQADGQGDIPVQDILPDCFDELLRYVYCDETRFNPPIANVCNLRKAAEKYNIQGLVTRCRDYINSVIAVENLCPILENAFEFQDEEIKEMCRQKLMHHTKAVFESQEFLNLSENCLVEILSLDDTDMSEEEIFEYVLMWAGKECQRRNLNEHNDQHLKVVLTEEILKNIRFSHMNPAYFTDNISFRGMLSLEEKVRIMRFYTTKRGIPEKDPRRKRIVFNRFKEIITGKGYFRENYDTIDFNLSKDTKLQEIHIYGSCETIGTYRILLEVKKGSDTLTKKETEVATDGKKKTYPITLPEPVPVSKDVTYTLSMKMEGPPSYYGDEGIKQITSNGVTIQFSVSNPPGLNGTSDRCGQFASFVFID